MSGNFNHYNQRIGNDGEQNETQNVFYRMLPNSSASSKVMRQNAPLTGVPPRGPPRFNANNNPGEYNRYFRRDFFSGLFWWILFNLLKLFILFCILYNFSSSNRKLSNASHQFWTSSSAAATSVTASIFKSLMMIWSKPNEHQKIRSTLDLRSLVIYTVLDKLPQRRIFKNDAELCRVKQFFYHVLNRFKSNEIWKEKKMRSD